MRLRTLAACSVLAGLLGGAPALHPAEPHVLRDLAIPSPTLGQPIPCSVTLPDEYYRDSARHFPVLLLLHGTAGTANDWLDAGGLADASVPDGDLPFIIVTPGAGNSWYVDNGSVAWETALVDDLLPAIDARFRTVQGRAGRAIAGLSMGGYGAMHLALRHPDQFAAVASLSGALYAPDDPLTDDDIADFHGAFGDPFDPDLFARQSVYTDLSELPSDATPPRVYLASGGRDQYGFDVSAMRLYQALKEHNVPATLVVRADYDHGWQFWHDDLGAVLSFASAALRMAAEAGTQ
jgi:S-formylglutathione hydrolase FrmB